MTQLTNLHDEHDPEDPDADHDHDGKPQLGEVARLDTCVTVVDSAEFYNNLESMNTYGQGETVGTIAELMMEIEMNHYLQEPGALPFIPNIRSQFQHVFIIVRAHNPCSDNTHYRYQIKYE